MSEFTSINYLRTLILKNSGISDNSASISGGGILNLNGGTLTLTNNTAGYGGGIYNGYGDANHAFDDRLNKGGPLMLTNSTISGNTATEGGGILANGNSQANITFCTINGNVATDEGGGIAIVAYNTNQPSQVEMRNSLVAGNYAGTGPDISRTLTLDGYNLIQNVSGAIFIPNKQHFTDVSVDPHTDLRIDPALSGKLTQIHALLSGSPAIDHIPLDACHVNSITTDHRGVKRPDENESACDIGAYEYVDSPPDLLRDGLACSPSGKREMDGLSDHGVARFCDSLTHHCC